MLNSHRKKLRRAKRMILVNTDYISGKELEMLGLVKGSTIQSRHVGKDITQSFKTLVGGELTAYNEMMNEARAIATKRMVGILLVSFFFIPLYLFMHGFGFWSGFFSVCFIPFGTFFLICVNGTLRGIKCCVEILPYLILRHLADNGSVYFVIPLQVVFLIRYPTISKPPRNKNRHL